MKFVTYSDASGVARPGVLLDDSVVDISSRFRSVLSVIHGGDEAHSAAQSLVSGVQTPLDAVTLLAPLLDPPRIFCVGLNYRDHAVESKMEIPKVPTVFLKLSSALVG